MHWGSTVGERGVCHYLSGRLLLAVDHDRVCARLSERNGALERLRLAVACDERFEPRRDHEVRVQLGGLAGLDFCYKVVDGLELAPEKVGGGQWYSNDAFGTVVMKRGM